MASRFKVFELRWPGRRKGVPSRLPVGPPPPMPPPLEPQMIRDVAAGWAEAGLYFSTEGFPVPPPPPPNETTKKGPMPSELLRLPGTPSGMWFSFTETVTTTRKDATDGERPAT